MHSLGCEHLLVPGLWRTPAIKRFVSNVNLEFHGVSFTAPWQYSMLHRLGVITATAHQIQATIESLPCD